MAMPIQTSACTHHRDAAQPIGLLASDRMVAGGAYREDAPDFVGAVGREEHVGDRASRWRAWASDVTDYERSTANGSSHASGAH